MKTSLLGNLRLIFLLSALRRTAERILVHATKTAAKRSLNQAHRFAMLSECCLDMALDQFGTSFNNFWNIMRVFLPLESFVASSYISWNTSIIGGHMIPYNCPRYSLRASTKILRLSIYH